MLPRVSGYLFFFFSSSLNIILETLERNLLLREKWGEGGAVIVGWERVHSSFNAGRIVGSILVSQGET